MSICFEICPYCGKEIDPVIEINIEKHPDGQTKAWTEIMKDSYDVTVNKRTEEFIYYGSGEVKEINQKRYDEKDNLLEHKKIFHTLDDKNPTTQIVKEA